MDEDNKQITRFELSNRFYYLFIEWPDNPVPKYYWKQNDGQLINMGNMGLDHLKASIRLVEKNLGEIQGRNNQVVSVIKPAALSKLNELREIFQEKVGQ